MVFDEVLDCLVVRLTFSVICLELLVLMGGFHELPMVLSCTVLELALPSGFGGPDIVSETWKKLNKIKGQNRKTSSRVKEKQLGLNKHFHDKPT